MDKISDCCGAEFTDEERCGECFEHCGWVYDDEDDGQGGDMTGAGDLEDNIINGR